MTQSLLCVGLYFLIIFFIILYHYLILSILIKVQRDHSAHLSTGNGPEYFLSLPVETQNGAIPSHYGEAVVLAETTGDDDIHAVGSLFEEQVSVVVDIVC